MDTLLDQAAVRLSRRKLTVCEYELMAAVGILHEDDRTVKLPLYARAVLPECWIVDIADKAEVLPLVADGSIEVKLDIVFA